MTEDEHPGMGPGRGRLKGKVAIVTGADSGIGRATARLFAREGAAVVCADIRESGAPRIDALIQQEGGRAAFVQADARSQADWQRVVDAAVSSFRGLDILFNNAGDGVRGRIDELREEEWAYVLDLNLNSIFHGVRAALPHLQRSGRGAIINNASTFGLLATDRYASYCATKAAIVNLTRQMAIDYGPGIRVNCICPGVTDSPHRWGPVSRPATGPGCACHRASPAMPGTRCDCMALARMRSFWLSPRRSIRRTAQQGAAMPGGAGSQAGCE